MTLGIDFLLELKFIFIISFQICFTAGHVLLVLGKSVTGCLLGVLLEHLGLSLLDELLSFLGLSFLQNLSNFGVGIVNRLQFHFKRLLTL